VEIATAADEAGEGRALDDAGISDVEAFSRAYERYRLGVYRYLRARGATDADALDLTAITFERAFAGRHAFRARGGGLGAWLFRIARNAAVDAHRRSGRRPDGPLTDGDDVGLAVAADHAERERQEIVDAVSGLRDVQREAISLRYVGGLSAREIGLVLGKSEAAIQKQIQRALDALREVLE
jgi:RNA polymerase sigma-70 factor (ECF subfamily)